MRLSSFFNCSCAKFLNQHFFCGCLWLISYPRIYNPSHCCFFHLHSRMLASSFENLVGSIGVSYLLGSRVCAKSYVMCVMN